MSEVILFLRFPLAVLIVLLHARFQSGAIGDVYFSYTIDRYPIYCSFSDIMSDYICQIAVPMFFILSGYLFFYNVSSFSWEVYKKKMHRRVHSLLIPYLFWNSLIILFYFFIQSFFPGLTSGINKFVSSYTLNDWFHAYWDINGGPIVLQFWFIRDLMVISVLTPVLYFLINKLSYFYVIFMGLLWLFGYYTNITALEIRPVFFFSLGALFTIKKYDLLKLCNGLLIPCAFIGLAVMVLELLYNNGYHLDWFVKYYGEIDRIGLLSLMVVCIAGTSWLLEHKLVSVNKFLLQSNFFIFAYHGVTLALIAKIVLKYFAPHTDFQSLVIYAFNPTLTIVLGLCIFDFLQRYFPRFTKVITGARGA